MSVPPREPEQVDLFRTGDVADDLEGSYWARDQVVVHLHVAHLLIGIAIADHESGVTVVDGPLHEATTRSEVHDVVLVDPRWAEQQRDLVHLRSAGRVLDQLHQFVAEHNLAWCDRHVLADRVRAGTTWRGIP